MPGTNSQTAGAQPAQAPDIGAIFAALLAGTQGGAANIMPPLPGDAAQAPQTGNAAVNPAPVNIMLPATQDQPAAAETVSDAQPATPDPAMAFVAPNIPAQPATDSKSGSAPVPAVTIPLIAMQMAVNPSVSANIPAVQEIAQPQADATATADTETGGTAPQETAAPKPGAKDQAKDNIAAVAVPAAFVTLPQTQAIAAKTTDTAVGDATSAPKQAAPQSDMRDAAIPAQQAKADAGIVSAAAQSNTKPAPAPQTTQAQALPVQFDLSSNNQNAQTNSGGQQQNPQRNAQPQQPAPVHAMQSASVSAAPVPAAQQDNSANNNNVSAAPQIAAVTAAIAQPAPVHAAMSIQVSPQANPAAMPYDAGAIALTVAAKAHDGDHQFDIRLDPPELGSIAVHLSIGANGQAIAHLTADKPQTLQLLQNDSGNLQSALKDAGLNLANNGLNFSLRGDQRQAGQPFQRGSSRGRALSVNAVASPADSAPATLSSYAPGALDITV